MTKTTAALGYPVPTFLTPRGVQVESVMDFHSLRGYVRHLRPVLSSLDSLLQDLTRESLEGLSPVFCLDFSELHDLLVVRGDSDDRDDLFSPLSAASTVLRAAIDSGRHAFALLPGTVFELRRFLLRALEESGIPVSEQTKARDDSPAMRMSMLAGFPDQADETILNADEVLPRLEELRRLTDLLSAKASRFRWLLEKIEEKKLRLLHERAWFSKLVWPSIVFTEVLDELSKQRPNQSINNEEDALNYAFCVAASNRYKTTKKVYYLVARGHAVRAAFNRSPWHRDPVATQAAYSPSSLLRDPSYLAMRGHWEDLYLEDAHATREILSAFPTTFRETLTRLQALKKYTVGGRRRQRRIVDMSRVPQEVLQPIVDTARLFNERYAQHLRPLFLAWETHREAEGVWTPPGEVGDDLTPLIQELAERYSHAEEDARKLDETLSAVEESAREVADTVRGRLGLEAQISAAASERYGPEVVELTVHLDLPSGEDGDEVEREIVARADVFPQYFSMWWNTGIDLHSFFDCADYFARVHYGLAGGLDLQAQGEKLEKQGLGYIVKTGAAGTANYRYLSDTEHEIFPLNIFSREPILHTIAERGAVSVRLFTEYFDIWFNFEPQLRSGRRMGLLSHLAVPAVLAEFVATTTFWPISAVPLENAMTEHLAALIPRPTGEES